MHLSILVIFHMILLIAGWPRIQFFVTENLGRPPRDWQVPLLGKERRVPAYIEVGLDDVVLSSLLFI